MTKIEILQLLYILPLFAGIILMIPSILVATFSYRVNYYSGLYFVFKLVLVAFALTVVSNFVYLAASKHANLLMVAGSLLIWVVFLVIYFTLKGAKEYTLIYEDHKITYNSLRTLVDGKAVFVHEHDQKDKDHQKGTAEARILKSDTYILVRRVASVFSVQTVEKRAQPLIEWK